MSEIALLPSVRAFLARDHGLFVHGQVVASQSAAKLAVINPADGQTIAHIADANQADVEQAVASARQGFASWSRTSPAARAAVLFKLADLLEAHREELAQLETLQSGKLIGISRAFEVEQAAHFLRYYAGWATKITGQTITPSLPSFAGERSSAYTLREPIGVVVGIVPWNFATMIAIWKLASALTTGCSIVIKPSEFTPLTLLRIAELASEAGLPAGALNVLTGGGQVGKALIEHPGTDKVSFTGSVPTGIAVGQAAMGAKLTRATLELGGKNAVAFLPDVGIDKAVDGVIEAGFLHSGQICAAGERFYVHRSRIEPLLEALSQRLGQLKIGSPLDETTQFGPVANKPHQLKLAELFATARAEGSQIIHGGRLGDGPGCFVEPTVILAKSASDTLLDPAVPFGGIKASGIGREFGSAFIDDFTELKSVMIRY